MNVLLPRAYRARDSVNQGIVIPSLEPIPSEIDGEDLCRIPWI